MDSVAVDKPESNRLLERRRSSQINHINRIRDANAKRQFVPIWADLEEDNDKSKSAEILRKSSSAATMEKKSSHKTCVPYRSAEHFGAASVEDKDLHQTTSERKMSREAKRRRSLESKEISERRKSTSQEPIATSTRKKQHKSLILKKSTCLKRVLAQDDVSREFLGKPVNIPSKKRSSRNNKVKTSLKPKTVGKKKIEISNATKRNRNARKKLNEKECSENNRILDSDQDYDLEDDVPNLKETGKNQKVIKKDQNRMETLNEKKYLEKHSMDSDQDSENSAYGKLVNAANLKKPFTTKDIIVLKWLHKTKCPEACKSEASESESVNSKGDQKYPIEILKSPAARKDNQKRYDNTSEENIKSKSFEFHPSIEHVSLEGTSQRSIFSGNVDLETRKTNEYQHMESEDASRDVEMRVTELGKLQIVLNLKSLSPEDSAVVVWLDDLPRSDMKPDFQKRLSISSLETLREPRSPPILKSHSTQALEDEASPKPNIHFPPLTILKNLAVDSKSKMKDLEIDPSDYVFYKRCNLSHSEELFDQF